MSDYMRKTWKDGEVIDADKLNNMEAGITEAKKEAENAKTEADKHASRHGANGADPITPAMIGAAPAGFGLGVSGVSTADFHSVENNGWFTIDAGTANSPFLRGIGLTLKRTGDTVVRIAQGTRFLEEGIVIAKTIDGINWVDEWISPPMQLGIEYRTIYRRNGKPEYWKTIQYTTDSTVTGDMTVNIPHGIDNLTTSGFEINCTIGGFQLPYAKTNQTSFIEGLDTANIWLTLSGTQSHKNKLVVITIKYTKTTD